MLARATIHPKLIDDPSYDGFHLKKTDAEHIVKQLPGKPIQVEHQDKHVVGKIVSAFEANGGIDIVFETNDKTFKDTLSNEMLSNGMLKDVSMTVSAIKGYRDGVPTILSKNVSEVSLVERGAIPGSHISWSVPRLHPREKSTIPLTESKEYIGKNTSSNQKRNLTMSTESSTTDNSPQVLADQIREMERNRLEIEAEREKLRRENEILSKKNAELSAEQTAERVKMVEGDVASLFNHVLKRFEEQSKDKDKYRSDMESWMRNMKEKESSHTLTEVFAQASQLLQENFNKVETSFQREKEAAELAKKEKEAAEKKAAEWQQKEADYQKRINEFVQTINNIRSGSFTSVNDRFIEKLPEVGSSSSAPSSTSVITDGVAVKACASAYFDAGFSPLDGILTGDENVKRIRASDYVTPDNADIFAGLNAYRDVS